MYIWNPSDTGIDIVNTPTNLLSKGTKLEAHNATLAATKNLFVGALTCTVQDDY